LEASGAAVIVEYFKMSRALIFFVLSAVFFYTSCSSVGRQLVKDPEVKVVNFNITDISLQDISLDIVMNVKNPNPMPIKLDQISYNLKFSGEQVTEGVLSQGVNIPASGQSDVTVPLKFKYSSLGNLVTSLFKNTFKREYELEGRAKLGLFSIPFSKKGEVQFNK
jgi:LEA14-like dessication related protein